MSDQDRVSSLIKQIVDLKRDKADWEIETYIQVAKIKRLEEQIKHYREGLKFYADPSKYQNEKYWQIVNDEGRTARKHLGRSENEV